MKSLTVSFFLPLTHQIDSGPIIYSPMYINSIPNKLIPLKLFIFFRTTPAAMPCTESLPRWHSWVPHGPAAVPLVAPSP